MCGCSVVEFQKGDGDWVCASCGTVAEAGSLAVDYLGDQQGYGEPGESERDHRKHRLLFSIVQKLCDGVGVSGDVRDDILEDVIRLGLNVVKGKTLRRVCIISAYDTLARRGTPRPLIDLAAVLGLDTTGLSATSKRMLSLRVKLRESIPMNDPIVALRAIAAKLSVPVYVESEAVRILSATNLIQSFTGHGITTLSAAVLYMLCDESIDCGLSCFDNCDNDVGLPLSCIKRVASRIGRERYISAEFREAHGKCTDPMVVYTSRLSLTGSERAVCMRLWQYVKLREYTNPGDWCAAIIKYVCMNWDGWTTPIDIEFRMRWCIQGLTDESRQRHDRLLSAMPVRRLLFK